MQTTRNKTFVKMKCPVRCRFYTGLSLSMFGIVSVLLILAVYVTKVKYTEIDTAKNEIIALQNDLNNAEKLMNSKESQIPLFTTSFRGLDGKPKVVSIDRKTGLESELALDWPGISSLVAVPQVGFDGRIYVSLIRDEADFFSAVSEVNLKTGDVSETGLRSQSGILSPDQSQTVVFSSDISDKLYNDYLENQILVYNFNKGNITVVGELKNDESLTDREPDFNDPFKKVSINWVNNSCILVGVYQKSVLENGDITYSFKENREMCLN